MAQAKAAAAVTEPALNPQALSDVLAAVAISQLPDVHWLIGDDLCDCTFQQIGDWTNPYIARTLRVRLCCIWAAIFRQYPEHVQEIPAFYDGNRHKWVREAARWNSEERDMPVYLWLRQLASQTGKPLAQIREEYKDRHRERPKRVPFGTGIESQPSRTEVAAALEARLHASGWLI